MFSSREKTRMSKTLSPNEENSFVEIQDISAYKPLQNTYRPHSYRSQASIQHPFNTPNHSNLIFHSPKNPIRTIVSHQTPQTQPEKILPPIMSPSQASSPSSTICLSPKTKTPKNPSHKPLHPLLPPSRTLFKRPSSHKAPAPRGRHPYMKRRNAIASASVQFQPQNLSTRMRTRFINARIQMRTQGVSPNDLHLHEGDGNGIPRSVPETDDEDGDVEMGGMDDESQPSQSSSSLPPLSPSQPLQTTSPLEITPNPHIHLQLQEKRQRWLWVSDGRRCRMERQVRKLQL